MTSEQEKEAPRGVTASFLVTREDYANFKAAAVHAGFTRNELTALRIFGFLMVAAGVTLWALFGRGAISQTLWDMLLVLLGMVVSSFTDNLQPFFVRRIAVAYYDTHKEQMTAQTLMFGDSTLTVTTDRYEAVLPYALLHRVEEDGRVFLFYTGEYEMRFLPKRVLTNEDIEYIRNVTTKEHEHG